MEFWLYRSCWEVVYLKGGCCCHSEVFYQITVLVGPPHSYYVTNIGLYSTYIIREYKFNGNQLGLVMLIIRGVAISVRSPIRMSIKIFLAELSTNLDKQIF